MILPKEHRDVISKLFGVGTLGGSLKFSLLQGEAMEGLGACHSTRVFWSPERALPVPSRRDNSEQFQVVREKEILNDSASAENSSCELLDIQKLILCH